MSIPKTLRFGIQSLDKLIGTIKPGTFGVDLSESPSGQLNEVDSENAEPITSSICLTGPDGTGKSVFSLHLVSQYLGDCLKDAAKGEGKDLKVFYISTDLTYKMALKGWHHFALDYPFERREPLVELKEGRPDERGQTRIKVGLEQYFPFGGDKSPNNIVGYLEDHAPSRNQDSVEAKVCFVDLASSTAGDDWGFVHRLLSTLEHPGSNQPRHLMVLDAVEGFETLVGELNAFGETSSRRSRIAQVMRLAASKCHLLYVVEEAREERFPEEFVTDVVIRLRNVGTGRYLRRTVEIEKSRGQLHVRGQHPFVIRDGTGSTTGNQQNADDSAVRRWTSSLFKVDDLADPPKLVRALRALETTPQYLRKKFAPEVNKLIDEPGNSKQVAPDALKSLVQALNQILEGPSLEREEFPQLGLSEEARQRLSAGGDFVAINRRLLEDAFPSAIAKTHQSYIHIFPSLNYVSREIMNDKYNPREQTPATKFAAFGITYLDNMLGGTGERAERAQDGKGEYLGFDTRGLPCGSATALIGDSLTQKSQLGQAFLSRAFYPYAQELAKQINLASEESDVRELLGRLDEALSNPVDSPRKLIELRKIIAQFTDQKRQALFLSPAPPRPVAVMFTTQDVNNRNLADKFYEWLKPVEAELGPLNEITETPSLAETEDPDDAEDLADTKERRQPPKNFVEEITRELKKRFKQFAASETPKIEHFKRTLKEYLKKAVFENRLKEHIETHTICRRFEIHDLPGPVLVHIFQRSIEKAQRVMLGKPDNEALDEPKERYHGSWRIRVVIDDLNSFRNTYPEVRDDHLVLPSLLFNLGREGVTPLIIDTQSSGSPELSLTERFDSSVRELVQNRIYTWRLPFYGENRIAISIIPPISHEYRGVIRELRWETKDKAKSDPALSVDPHFELYMGLERGQPQPVPLEVRLFEETPSFKRYVEQEEKLFSEIFTPLITRTNQDNPSIIRPAGIGEYSTLRDSCHLQRDTRIDHTTIMQVDEFWWLRRPPGRLAGAFRSQWDYLHSVTATREAHGRIKSEPVTDPFGVFQPRALRKDNEPLANEEAGSGLPGDSHSVTDTSDERQARQTRRLDLFDEKCGYRLIEINEPGKTEAKQAVDRVPFVWDFGFLLCNSYAWEAAAKTRDEGGTKVRKVWEQQLRKAEPTATPSTPEKAANTNNPHQPPVSWREFLYASKLVAEFQAYRTSTPATAFDFTMLSPESFSCLILEMWASEVYGSLRQHEEMGKRDAKARRKRIIDHVGTREWNPEDPESKHPEFAKPKTLLDALKGEREMQLQDILEERKNGSAPIRGYSLELYKVWLLLLEVLNFPDLVDSSSHLNFEFKSRDVDCQAVSARHWYATASKFNDSLTPEQLEYNWRPARLPGHFSVRGDWFLAVAGGSRSSRLADHALDLLSSKRANVTRLQEGIGLPTRELVGLDSHLRTRLICALEEGKPLANVEYEALRKIGASGAPDEEFYWLWRSGIAAYNRHSRIWHKWLNRTLLWWNSWHQRYGSNWARGFTLYDLLDDIEFKTEKPELMEKKELESWTHFGALRNILIDELEEASVSSV